jgi:hypothetical protein
MVKRRRSKTPKMRGLPQVFWSYLTVLILSLNDHWENSAIPLIPDPEVHITFGVIPESCTTPLVTSEVKSRTVCINTTITCGTMPFVSQDLDV